MTLSLTVETLETPIGGLLLAADGAGNLRAADFTDYEDRMRLLLDRRLGRANYSLSAGSVPASVKSAMAAYFSGDLGALRRIGVLMDGAPFQNAVWTALQTVEPGRPLAYSALARRLGRPQAARAVGHANGANPFSIVIPCHRLVGANGELTGYGGGLARKRWLLDHEARHAASDAPGVS